jgi:hypothetical protein
MAAVGERSTPAGITRRLATRKNGLNIPDLIGGRPNPAVDRVAHGLPDRVDRLAALGNAVLPTVAEHIGRIILDHHHDDGR